MGDDGSRPGCTGDLLAGIGIIGLCVAGAVAYGIVHDQVTVRICLEYFTVFHPPVFPTENPTLLALGWGVIATWWAGALIGVPLAIAARAGRGPKRSAKDLVRPVAVLLLGMAATAVVAGVVGRVLASRGVVVVAGDLAGDIPETKRVDFLTDLWIHNGSYLAGFIGGIVLAVRTWRRRRAGQNSI